MNNQPQSRIDSEPFSESIRYSNFAELVEQNRSEEEKQKLNLGCIGKIIGSGDNARSNIIILISVGILIFIGTGLVYGIYKNVIDATKIIDTFNTTLGVLIGYLFGIGSKK